MLNQRLKEYKGLNIQNKEIIPTLKGGISKDISSIVISEEPDENKSSSIEFSIPTKIHDFQNKLGSRLRNN